jgi:REP element-mobilizing transposase RayT
VSRNYYSEINLHVVWHCKLSSPLLTPQVEPLAHRFLRKLKGGASHDVNQQFGRQKVLEWQAGYGVVSFGTRDLPWVVDYIRNQREHHSRGTFHDRLERITQEETATHPPGLKPQQREDP